MPRHLIAMVASGLRRTGATTVLLVACTAGLCALAPRATSAHAADGVPLVHARQCAQRTNSPGMIVVPVVVDEGGSAPANVACVSVRPGSTGSQVLAARAKMLGRRPPRYAPSGLLCSIDGYPKTGCGQVVDGHYAYWAYFHGGSSWTYSPDGPAFWDVFAGDVEGWRFEPRGSGGPSDPPPRAPSAASALCPSGPSTTTTTQPSTTTPSSTLPSATTAPTTSATTPPGSGTATGAPREAATGLSSHGSRPPGTSSYASSSSTVPTATGATGSAGPAATLLPGNVTGALPTNGNKDPPWAVVISAAVVALVAFGAWLRLRRSVKTR